jgi:histidyl-tRNA synthetase
MFKRTISKKEPAKEEITKTASSFQLVRGVKDILPEDQAYFFWIFDKVRSLARSYGYDPIETPIMEKTNLFVRGVGKQTDIVEKEMFSFVDQGGDHLTLRPEGTAAIARAYIEHGMLALPQPVKFWYWGKMLRHERPQAGRLREFHQFGFESLGSDDAMIDAQIIFMTYKIIQELGLEVTIAINSIGSEECRTQYKKVLVDYFRTKRSELSDLAKKQLIKNPLRILDSKEENLLPIIAQAPQIFDYLNSASREHFLKVMDYLDELDVPVVLKPTLVRGLDYYNRTVFEIWTSDEESSRQSALGGGGRYDGLVEILGGRPTPAAGVAVGIERLVALLKEKEIKPPLDYQPDIFVAQLGEEAKRKSMLLFEQLRAADIKVAESLSKEGLKSQLEKADKLHVKYAIILGQKEILDGTVMLRDMENGIQEVIDINKIIPEIKKRLEKQLKIKAEQVQENKEVNTI